MLHRKVRLPFYDFTYFNQFEATWIKPLIFSGFFVSLLFNTFQIGPN